jgi:hypothetical protein
MNATNTLSQDLFFSPRNKNCKNKRFLLSKIEEKEFGFGDMVYESVHPSAIEPSTTGTDHPCASQARVGLRLRCKRGHEKKAPMRPVSCQ